MPDILVRGIEMPSKGCLRCPFNLYYANAVYCNCMIIKLLGKPSEAKYPNDVNCPLVELPAHGDLIDRSKLSFICACTAPNGMDYVRRFVVDDMPVIVPASEEVRE